MAARRSGAVLINEVVEQGQRKKRGQHVCLQVRGSRIAPAFNFKFKPRSARISNSGLGCIFGIVFTTARSSPVRILTTLGGAHARIGSKKRRLSWHFAGAAGARRKQTALCCRLEIAENRLCRTEIVNKSPRFLSRRSCDSLKNISQNINIKHRGIMLLTVQWVTRIEFCE